MALAVDMYGDGKVAADMKEAAALSGAIGKDPALGLKRFRAALEFIKKDPNVDGSRIAAIGYCFGGTTVLTMARKGLPLAGVVSFHGNLAPVDAPAAKGDISAKVLVCHGGADPFVSKEVFDGFLKEMADSGAEWQVSVYGKAVHSFTNPESDKFGNPGLGYNKTADLRSWAEMKAFLAEILVVGQFEIPVLLTVLERSCTLGA